MRLLTQEQIWVVDRVRLRRGSLRPAPPLQITLRNADAFVSRPPVGIRQHACESPSAVPTAHPAGLWVATRRFIAGRTAPRHYCPDLASQGADSARLLWVTGTCARAQAPFVVALRS
jgi:hypothetical protein